MKTKILTIIMIVGAKFGIAQYQQYEQYLTPFLSSPIESGFFYFTTPNNIQAGQLYNWYKINAPDPDNDMWLIDDHIDSLAQYRHFKYQQAYKNVPVEGAGCIEHYDKYGSLVFINAKIADSINKNATPIISKDEAINNLIEQLKKEDKEIVFAWEDEDWEKQIQMDYDNDYATWFPTAELIWAIDTMKDVQLVIPGSRFTLAYKIPITIILPHNETFNYYVDANTGEVLKVLSAHVHDGPANIYGYGSKVIDTRWKGGVTQRYILHSNDETRKIHTKKCDDCVWWAASEIKDEDDNWGSNHNKETAAHYHVANAWDYFRWTFGRTGMNDGAAEIKVKTQWDQANAKFNGSNGFPELVFGGNNGWGWGEEPSIVAHEFTHGVTSSSSNLQYEYESGALNESFSDIFGIVVQAVMLDGGATDWIMGNHIPFAVVRSLQQPQLYGQPGTYLGVNWHTGSADNGGVHTNSGVQNRWFYLLAHGETGTNNELDIYYHVNGIGINKAARIAYYAQTSLLMNSSQYSDSRQATIQAAKILFGECSVEYQSTITAWYAVGVGNQHTCSYTVSLDKMDGHDILVYPNPANTTITIELLAPTSEPIRIVDISGSLVKEINTNQVYFQTDISDLSNGVYLINFDFEGTRIVKRIIVQK